ncbi:protein of unknown function (plasmid) [Pararobbsia alpina]
MCSGRWGIGIAGSAYRRCSTCFSTVANALLARMAELTQKTVAWRMTGVGPQWVDTGILSGAVARRSTLILELPYAAKKRHSRAPALGQSRVGSAW